MSMEYYGAMLPNSTYGNFPNTTSTTTTNAEEDFMDELLFEGCWLESSSGFNFMQPFSSNPHPLVVDPWHYLPSFESNSALSNMNPHHQIYQQDHTADQGSLTENHHENYNCFVIESSSNSRSSGNGNGGHIGGSRLWIGPRAYPNPSSSVKERLMLAIGHLKECTKHRDVLIQIWVPVRKGGKQMLTTYDHPYYLNTNCKSLANYQLLTEEDSTESVRSPHRTFLGKLPEWKLDVRFFQSYEYPRVNYGQQHDARGSLAVPIFERGSGTCLGVIEFVMTTQMVNYRPEEYVCQALEAVDLRSSQNFIPPNIEACDELYQAALSEIVEVLTSVCKTNRLPLALTWAPCVQQGKGGCRHSDVNYARCVSTVDSACLVIDLEILGFHEACSKHHLFRGQGIVGTAFSTSKTCFATDITAFSKTEYPLSHYARMFGMHAAVAIPLRTVYTGSSDFVLEFFLPQDCHDPEEQKQMLNSLPIVIRQACRSLYVVDDKEPEEVMQPIRETIVLSDLRLGKEESQNLGPPSEETSEKESSWIAHMEAQQQGRCLSVLLDYQMEEPKEELKGTTHWDSNQGGLPNGQVFTDFRQLKQSSGHKVSVEGGGNSYSFGGHCSSGGRKAGRRRHTKTEKAISLQVLQQYFAGSLKDAAKSIGVCPTTLKRICRQHGITRWPSRKIKKVGQSLRKLQLVIDSVPGAEGAIQIGSFYSTFQELSFPKFQESDSFTSMKSSNQSKQLNSQSESGLFSQGGTTKSPSALCSQTSGLSVCAAEAKQHITNINGISCTDALMAKDPVGMLKRDCSDGKLLACNLEETKILPRSQSYKALSKTQTLESLHPMLGSSGWNFCDGGALRVKAYFGDEKIRFTLQSNHSFGDLQLELARRFNLHDISTIDIKYLDDDHEWVLLTCNADLEECMEIYKSSQSHTLQLSLQRAPFPNQGSSFGSSS
ncbi:protein NLP2 [Ziziphus jujuba]|uniref:Protein NLP2 n=1 Tax=Ziziphus jujuba TaxID=326968 RepID=A0A6P4AVA6_ZIZJJ|nr:protein NLP2 [Ziziphus jujuba]